MIIKKNKLLMIISMLIVLSVVFSLAACNSGGDDVYEPDTYDLPDASGDDTNSRADDNNAIIVADISSSFESNDGFVVDFNAVQVMAKGLDSDSGQFFDMNRFVAGKSTLLRLAFSEETEVEQDGSMLVTVYYEGQALIELLPYNAGITDTAYFTPRSMSDVSNWPAGEYVLEFVYGDSVATRTLTMFEARKIKVLAVPILANYGGRIVACEGEWKTAIQFTRDTYPLADDGIEYVLGNELDLSDDMFDLTTDEGCYYVWEALSNLQTPAKDYELILGFVRERQGEEANLQGYTYGLPANIITESDGDMQPTVAHEIAHCYHVGDEYPGGALNPVINPPPYGMTGSDWNDRDSEVMGMKEAVVSATDHHGNYNTGSVIYSEQFPFNTNMMSMQVDVGSFMGSGSDDINDYWITSDIWAQLFTAFTGVSISGDGQTNTGDNGQTDASGSADDDNNEFIVIDITGKLSETGDFRVSPWYTYEATAEDLTAKDSGDYCILMEDAAGNILSMQYFDVSFFTNSNPPVRTIHAPIDVTAQFIEGTSLIRIMQGDNQLYSVSVSSNAPVVSFTDIEEYRLFSGTETITWDGSDPDGDTVYYELWYCPDEEVFINLASDITQTSFTVDFDTLPGTEAGFFYLFATDGVNTSGTDSEWIAAEYIAPDIITEQSLVPEYKITDEILLDADIYDAQDGWLIFDGVTWFLDGREFMSGSYLWIFPYELPPGEHTFTLIASNSQGMTSERGFSFIIIDDESDLPDDWSREDIKQALSNGFIAPLKNVNAAITRGQFASLASNLYWILWDEHMPDPDYEEGVVTDCGNDDYDQFLMVELGLMEAPGGKFNPNGNLTEEEAAVILYRICAISTPEGEDPSDTVEMMVAACIEAGVMDISGDNIYTAGANITGRLALVRCSRLFEYLFGE